MMAADFTMDSATTSAGNMTNTTAEDEAALNSTRDQVTSSAIEHNYMYLHVQYMYMQKCMTCAIN